MLPTLGVYMYIWYIQTCIYSMYIYTIYTINKNLIYMCIYTYIHIIENFIYMCIYTLYIQKVYIWYIQIDTQSLLKKSYDQKIFTVLQINPIVGAFYPVVVSNSDNCICIYTCIYTNQQNFIYTCIYTYIQRFLTFIYSVYIQYI